MTDTTITKTGRNDGRTHTTGELSECMAWALSLAAANGSERAAWARSSIIDGCAAAWGGGHRAIPPCTVRPAAMTTLYVRDQSGFREAQPTDVLDRAHALLTQRYRTGSPVLTS